MKLAIATSFVLLSLLASITRAADDFASKVDLSPLRTITVQHAQTLKTLDSFARQTLSSITGSGKLDGHDALYTILDMSVRPESYLSRNLIKIRNVPLRKEFLRVASLSPDEQERIVHDGTVSLNFWMQDDVQQMLQEVSANDTRKADSIGQANGAAMTLGDLLHSGGSFPIAIIAPATTNTDDHIWHRLDEIAGTVPTWAADIKQSGQTPPAPLPNYDASKLEPVVESAVRLIHAWRDQDAAAVNAASVSLAAALPNVNPAVYPSELKRSVEVTYNRLAMMTIPAVMFYFFAFVFFLMSSNSGVNSLRIWGLRFFAIAFAVHTLGIGVRWWLVGSIPIKNEFESVMFSAWFGALVGLILELRRSRGIFGAGASFVGWMALLAIFTVPFVFEKSIGENIGQVNGVLMSYWLYIHVTMVTASYSLIGAGFFLSVWWLIKYYANYDTLARTPVSQIAGEARGFDIVTSGGGGGAVSLGFGATLARMFFMPAAAVVQQKVKARSEDQPDEARLKSFLGTLDACNLVVLQLAFWVLGAGIVCGAIWADQSWGRPWGWDPKETFALITWIVYLIVVHVRIATDDKAWWTAVLSVVGFFIMLFNWIGVNFFLVGLHSYA